MSITIHHTLLSRSNDSEMGETQEKGVYHVLKRPSFARSLLGGNFSGDFFVQVVPNDKVRNLVSQGIAVVEPSIPRKAYTLVREILHL